MVPRGTPTPAPMTVLLLLPSALNEGIEASVAVCVFVTEPGALLNVLLLDVDEGSKVFAVMEDVLDVVYDVVSKFVVFSEDIA